MSHKLTETDLEKIFIASRFKKRSFLLVFLYFIAIFIGFFILVTYALNYAAINKKIAFWYKDEFGITDHQLADAVAKYKPSDAAFEQHLPEIANNSIFIENIEAKAPITFDVENNEKSVSENLKKGVIQIAKTSKPGQEGNVFITGHSSNYPWVKSDYNSIFALLPEVVVGDLIQVKYENGTYIYRVTKVFTVDPTEMSVLESKANTHLLTLMTCTPIGTNLKRLIVQSEQIIPLPPEGKSNSTQKVTLPAGVR